MCASLVHIRLVQSLAITFLLVYLFSSFAQLKTSFDFFFQIFFFFVHFTLLMPDKERQPMNTNRAVKSEGEVRRKKTYKPSRTTKK